MKKVRIGTCGFRILNDSAADARNDINGGIGNPASQPNPANALIEANG
jgi:hypothetical protein